MIIIYKTADLSIEQLVHVSSDDYTDMLDADPERGWIKVAETLMPHEIAVIQQGDGVVAVRRQPFDIAGPTAATVDEEASFTGIPEGTHIDGDAGYCVMDDSGQLDVSFETPGTYRISFNHGSYLYEERYIEVAAVQAPQ